MLFSKHWIINNAEVVWEQIFVWKSWKKVNLSDLTNLVVLYPELLLIVSTGADDFRPSLFDVTTSSCVLLSFNFNLLEVNQFFAVTYVFFIPTLRHNYFANFNVSIVSYVIMALLNVLLTLLLIDYTKSTIDLNAAELQYISDHLTQEECRRLIAAAHFKSYEEPNALDQAERKISKDLTCIQLLHHWNFEPNEGKGETHEVLEHRLRQMGKYELADWLGRTVFHELAVDLNRSLEEGFKGIASEKSTSDTDFGPTLIPVVQDADPSEYSLIDNLLYVLIIGLLLTTFGITLTVGCSKLRQCLRKRKTEKRIRDYHIIADTSGSSESEDKFDLRDYTRKHVSAVEDN